MYFPDDMNFQYFFFDTYIGYFLQALPFALIVGVIYFLRRRKRNPAEAPKHTALSALFPCYLTSLCCLTLLLGVLHKMYYVLFYHLPSGNGINWFRGEFDLELSLLHDLTSENIGNLLMLLPFGILYPLFDRRATLKRTITAGIFTVFLIELLQPIFGRSFDLNDIVLNCFGIILSATVFFCGRKLLSTHSKP